MNTTLLMGLWLSIGYILFIYLVYRLADKITVGDLIIGLLISLLGPIMILFYIVNLVYIYYNKVIYQRKCK